jgi:hypothetical protein
LNLERELKEAKCKSVENICGFMTEPDELHNSPMGTLSSTQGSQSDCESVKSTGSDSNAGAFIVAPALA